MHRSPVISIGATIFGTVIVLNLIVFGMSFAKGFGLGYHSAFPDFQNQEQVRNDIDAANRAMQSGDQAAYREALQRQCDHLREMTANTTPAQLEAEIRDMRARLDAMAATAPYPGMSIQQTRDQAESNRLWNHAMVRLQRGPSQTTICRDTRSGP